MAPSDEFLFSFFFLLVFFFNDTATTEIYTLSLHDALPIFSHSNHNECKTSAFRTNQSRRLSPDKVHRDYLLTTTIHISGLSDAAYFLDSLSFVLTLLGLHVRFTTNLMVNL